MPKRSTWGRKGHGAQKNWQNRKKCNDSIAHSSLRGGGVTIKNTQTRKMVLQPFPVIIILALFHQLPGKHAPHSPLDTCSYCFVRIGQHAYFPALAHIIRNADFYRIHICSEQSQKNTHAALFIQKGDQILRELCTVPFPCILCSSTKVWMTEKGSRAGVSSLQPVGHNWPSQGFNLAH